MKWFRSASLAALAGILCLGLAARPADAGSISFGGWTATWHSSADLNLSLAVDFIGEDRVVIQKMALFNEGPSDLGFFIDPLVITFQQTSHDAVQYIIINDEQVINQTGLPWLGFNFIIMNGTTGTTADSRFLPEESFGGSSPFSIDPFTSHQFLGFDADPDNPIKQILTVNGGVLPSSPEFGPNVWFPGKASGALWIDAAPTRSGTMKAFTLKEQPIIIPLPAAAWMALSSLMGLGVFGYRKNLRRMVA